MSARQEKERNLSLFVAADDRSELSDAGRRGNGAAIVAPAFGGESGEFQCVAHGWVLAGHRRGAPSAHPGHVFLAPEYEFDRTRLVFNEDLESHGRSLAEHRRVGKAEWGASFRASPASQQRPGQWPSVIDFPRRLATGANSRCTRCAGGPDPAEARLNMGKICGNFWEFLGICPNLRWFAVICRNVPESRGFAGMGVHELCGPPAVAGLWGSWPAS